MLFSKILLNNFEIGYENLKRKSGDLNPFSKLFQSPNIPKQGNIAISVDNEEEVLEKFDQILNFKNIDDAVPNYINTSKCVNFPKDEWVNCVLTYFDSNFIYNSNSQKEKEITSFKQDLLEKFPSIFNKSVFKEYKKFVKNQVYKTLFNLEYDETVLHIISVVKNVNLILLKPGYYTELCVYDERKPNLILFENGEKFGVVLDKDFEYKRSFNQLEVLRTKRIKILSNPKYAKKFTKMLSLPKSEIEKIAKSYNIEIEGKTKQKLIDEITLKI